MPYLATRLRQGRDAGSDVALVSVPVSEFK
jgi:hypothetical protein